MRFNSHRTERLCFLAGLCLFDFYMCMVGLFFYLVSVFKHACCLFDEDTLFGSVCKISIYSCRKNLFKFKASIYFHERDIYKNGKKYTYINYCAFALRVPKCLLQFTYNFKMMEVNILSFSGLYKNMFSNKTKSERTGSRKKCNPSTKKIRTDEKGYKNTGS